MKRIIIIVLISLLALPSFAISFKKHKKGEQSATPAEKSVAVAEKSTAETKIEKVMGEMVLLSGGEFWMGLHEELINKAYEIGKEKEMKSFIEDALKTEMPRHKVVVDPFYIDKYEVTNAEFAVFVKETSYRTEGNWAYLYKSGMDSCPVVGVTWNDAEAYAKWAGKRLPTEAEWEFAARAGMDDQLFPWGDEISSDKANYALKESLVSTRLKTSEVGSYQPNLFGIHDMIGNAAEWCADWYGKDYYSKSPEKNPLGPENGKVKVIRGGGWMTPSFFCRISCRGSMKADLSNQQIGFRCARSLNP